MIPQIRIKLERVDVVERARGDVLLSSSELVRRAGAEVLKAGIASRLGERAQLFQQGEPGHSLYFVLLGQVRLYAHASGEGVELGQVGPGEVVGEGGVLEPGSERSASAIAQGQVEVVELRREALGERGFEQLAPYLAALAEQRAQRLKELTEFLSRW